MRRKIAENLRLAVGYDRPGPMDDTETLRKAWAELSALLAVVRAADVLAPRGKPYPTPEETALIRALAKADPVCPECDTSWKSEPCGARHSNVRRALAPASRPQRAGRGRG